jgi:hypothetical protein
VPSLLTMSAVVLTAQAAVVLATGELWLFLLQFPLANIGLTVAFARTARGQNPVVADPRGCPRPPATAIGPGPLKPDRLRRWVSPTGHDKPRLDEIKRAAAADVAVIREHDGSVSPNAAGLQNDDL